MWVLKVHNLTSKRFLRPFLFPQKNHLFSLLKKERVKCFFLESIYLAIIVCYVIESSMPSVAQNYN